MRLTSNFVFVCVPLIGSITVQAAISTPIVDLGYAQYQGVPIQDKVTNATHTQFLGMRYAAPPTGSRRFRAPSGPAPTPGIQQANNEPSRCFAAGVGTAPSTPFRIGNLPGNNSISGREYRRAEDEFVPGFSEDCLFLNVYIPGTFGQRKGLPVVFWIHGGGYVEGSASGTTGTDIADGNDLVRESGEGVVVVIIQYRLGLFGFLPGQKVKDGGDLYAGLLDQQFALEWVQQHIAKFGGDPQKVTIWGVSAGAGSVLQHVIANDGNTKPPLFRGAITSSTFLPSQYKFNDRIPEILYSETLAQTNCSSAEDTLDCLCQVDVNILEAANTEINNSGFFGSFVFVPVVDGTFITERPTQLLKEGKVNEEILYSVTNTFEGTSFVDQSTANTVQIPNYVSQLFPNFGTKEIQAATAQYAGLGSNIFQANAIMGESIFICPTYYLLRGFRGRAFKGEFAIPPGLHGSDVPYYFTSGVTPPYGNAAFDDAFAQSFLDLAMSLNTNVKWDPTNSTPPWKLWHGSNEMLFNRTEAGAPDIRAIQTSEALLRRCEFWEVVSAATAQ